MKQSCLEGKKTRTFLLGVVVAGVVLLLGTPPAAAQETVFNGSFGTDLRGWTLDNTPVAWSARDAAGRADSGSVLIVNLGSRNNAQGISQCLEQLSLTEGTEYTISAQIHLPQNQTNTGHAAVGLNWHAGEGCTNKLHVGGPRAEVDHPNGGFEEVAAQFTVPEGAKSATFVAYVTKNEDDGALLAYMDDISIVRVGSSPARAPVYVPGAAHVKGFGGAVWRTDLEVNNPTTGEIPFTVELLKRDQANTNPQSASFTVKAGNSLRLEDVIHTVFGFDGAAALRITPAKPTLVVTSRTFNQSAEGTYGQFLPGIPGDQATVYGSRARLIQLTHDTSAGSGYRTNIGLVNVTALAITVTLHLHSADGNELGTLTVDLPASGFVQLDKVFEQVTASDVSDGYALLSTPTPGGAFLAYASVIDNATGDAVCVQVAGL